MKLDLSRNLHALTARLDRAADRMLRSEAGLSYSRFLTLYLVGREGAQTQRSLAELIGVTEPSVSRMIGVLQRLGQLEVGSAQGNGNRRFLRLTAEGQSTVERWGPLLEERLASLVEASGVSYSSYLSQTKQLLGLLEASPSATPPLSALAGVAQRRTRTT